MLTALTIRNFKRFNEVTVELGNPVVFVGPNDSGKTTALQALALWDIGLRKWNEKRAGRSAPEKRPGVTVNRRDLIAVPVPYANLLWRDLHVRDVQRQAEDSKSRQQTRNIRIDIIVEGVTADRAWKCGLEFDYANEESFYCRPLRLSEARQPERMPIPEEASRERVCFLPPMSGLADREFAKQAGEISFLLGQGRTAEVLRNLCWQVSQAPGGGDRWSKVCGQIKHLFGVSLDAPQYLAERGELVMTYRDRRGIRLDLSSSGRGMQQTLLLLIHMAANPNSVLLLDEPDAHLEILRQRQIYQVLTDTAREHRSQVILASHSEVILNEAADRDVVVAFLGRPHRIDDRGSQLLKSLKSIGYADYYQAELRGWVLYLEGSTDLTILRVFADKLRHEAGNVLEQPFVHYVGNHPSRASDHFFGLREAKPDLAGIAVFDRLSQPLQACGPLKLRMWRRREIESYLCTRRTLLAWSEAAAEELGPVFAASWVSVMDESIRKMEDSLRNLRKGDPWGPDLKVSEEFLEPVFCAFFDKLGLPNRMNKSDYHDLARYLPVEEYDAEISQVLDDIVATAKAATPFES